MSLLNLIVSVQAYSDQVPNDDPQLRNVDWTRRIRGIHVGEPVSNSVRLAPGQNYTIFDGTFPTTLSGASNLSISLISAQYSRYRVNVNTNDGGFRTLRAISGLTTCTVTINNNSVALFNFDAAVLSAVQVGDIMRIAGQQNFDPGPYDFSPFNSGLWQVLSIAGSEVQVARLTGQDFSGINETVSVVSTDVQFYSATGVQIGSLVQISGTFSQVTQRSYALIDVTPNSFDFISALPLPNQSDLTYVASSIVFYQNAKKYVYIEADQDSYVQFNGDTSTGAVINPFTPGNKALVGHLSKSGLVYSVSITNASVNPMNVLFILAE